jgi:hypothetical protein
MMVVLRDAIFRQRKTDLKGNNAFQKDDIIHHSVKLN